MDRIPGTSDNFEIFRMFLCYSELYTDLDYCRAVPHEWALMHLSSCSTKLIGNPCVKLAANQLLLCLFLWKFGVSGFLRERYLLESLKNGASALTRRIVIIKWRVRRTLLGLVEGPMTFMIRFKGLESFWKLVSPGKVHFGDNWILCNGLHKIFHTFEIQNLPIVVI